MRRKFVRGQFKDADDARRTIASLENQRTTLRTARLAAWFSRKRLFA